MARADRGSDYKRNEKNVKKADIIIGMDKEISAKVDELYREIRKTDAKVDALLGGGKDGSGENFESLREEIRSIKRELDFLAAQNSSVFTELKRIIREWAEVSPGRSYQYRPGYGAQEIDYDKLAEKVADIMPVQEQISADYIACKVAEQIVLPDGAPAAPAKESAPAPYAVSGVNLNLDEDELADRVALKIGSIKAEDFDIIVDDDGCSSISEGITQKLDYDAISSTVAEKLRSALSYDNGADYDEMAAKISEKITVAGINEDAIAEKAAAVLSNHLPEIDADELADKVAGQILSGMPAADVDSEAISKNISDRLIESQENHDYDIVIDEEGLDKITGYVSEEIDKKVDGRFDEVNRKIDELKAMIAGGMILGVKPSEQTEAPLVTVSDVVENKQDAEETCGETGEEGITDAALLGEMVEELSEVPAEGEVTDDLVPQNAGGVDFEHMMKYNRSFIARIIQSTDEQKEYYGRVKTALLSYAKVNSNVGWGSERFNKGRETVARFKIRGKTLCLYLALSPEEYKTSVYHHVDVSDNKSMHGTPMMVKIKSPLGVKKAIRLIDEMLSGMGAVKRNKVTERDYAAMYPYESMEELIEDGLVKEVDNNL